MNKNSEKQNKKEGREKLICNVIIYKQIKITVTDNIYNTLIFLKRYSKFFLNYNCKIFKIKSYLSEEKKKLFWKIKG